MKRGQSRRSASTNDSKEDSNSSMRYHSLSRRLASVHGYADCVAPLIPKSMNGKSTNMRRSTMASERNSKRVSHRGKNLGISSNIEKGRTGKTTLLPNYGHPHEIDTQTKRYRYNVCWKWIGQPPPFRGSNITERE